MKNDLHLVCPHCQSINRVPTAKLWVPPICGRCQPALVTGAPGGLTTAPVARHGEREPRIRLAKVNTEAEPHLAAQFGIRSIPTLALFQGGREIARQAGVMGAQDIVRWTSTQVGR